MKKLLLSLFILSFFLGLVGLPQVLGAGFAPLSRQLLGADLNGSRYTGLAILLGTGSLDPDSRPVVPGGPLETAPLVLSVYVMHKIQHFLAAG
jgi:hypothetical protein